jgi:hypothetical protein
MIEFLRSLWGGILAWDASRFLPSVEMTISEVSYTHHQRCWRLLGMTTIESSFFYFASISSFTRG